MADSKVRWRGAVAASALLAACASTPAGEYNVFFSNNLEKMQMLMRAAQDCGYDEARLSTAGQDSFSISIPVPDQPLPEYDCTIQWISSHPEAGFPLPG